MTPGAPFDRVFAEACAFPYFADRAFEQAATALDRDALGDACTEHLRTRASGASLDALATLRDRAWFGDTPAHPRPLVDHLVALAGDHLEHRGAVLGLRLDADAELPSLAQRWRWLSLRLPADLLVAARCADRGTVPDEHVSLVTQHLARTLEAPCAETHLHLGAAVAFGALWTALMPALARRADRAALAKNLARFERALDGRKTAVALARFRAAAFARLLLSTWLHGGARTPFDPWRTQALTELAKTIRWPWGATAARRAMEALLAPLTPASKLAALDEVTAVDLLRAITGDASAQGDTPFDTLALADPLATHWRRANDEVLPETRWCAQALAALRRGARDDRGFARMFWQYQRVRTRAYHLLVQEPGVGGLVWFTGFYERIAAFRRLLPRHRGEDAKWFHALRMESRDLNLRALEARTAPDDTRQDQRDTLRAVASQTLAWTDRDRARTPPEAGYVFHFIKERGPKRGVSHDDPRGNRFGTRQGAWLDAQMRRARTMTAVLRDHPELLVLMRGLDAANLEGAQPTWVLLPLYDEVRRASVETAERLARVVPTWRVPAMRATLHGGEDFLRLVEGVRRMHEALEFGLLQHGDRVGHGLAVGVDPTETLHRECVQPREDRLDDLLWELDRYGRGELLCAPARVERVRREALELARAIYGEEHSVDVWIEARRLRHDLRRMRQLRLPEGGDAGDLLRNADTGMASRRLHARHLVDAGVYVRGRVGVPVRADASEVELLQGAQAWLRHVLARREITIEANPSSNLLIGDHREFATHPVMRLQPTDPSTREGPAVQVSINTDDPVTFASTLADEYAYVYAALLRNRVSSSDALAWIAARRDDAWRSRFTTDASARRDVLERIVAQRR